MTSTTYSMQDEIHSLASDALLTEGSALVEEYISASQALNTIAPIGSVTVISNVLTITLKDARAFTVTSDDGAPPKFQITTGSNSFLQAEIALLQALIHAINDWMKQGSLTTLTDTYN